MRYSLRPRRGRADSSGSGTVGVLRTTIEPAVRRAATLTSSHASRMPDVVEPAVGAAALGALAGRARDGLRDREHVAQLEDEVPAWVEAAAGRLPPACCQRASKSSRRAMAASRSASVRKMPTSDCIVCCRSSWRRLGSSPAVRSNGASAMAAMDSATKSAGSAAGVRAIGGRPSRRAVAAAPPLRRGAEHEQVREGVAPEAVGAVKAGGDLAGRVEARQRRRAGLGIDADAAHHVVRRSGRPPSVRP